jgi:hypothetical protein
MPNFRANFFGFISDDVIQNILMPNQWLLRCDDESFVITISRQDPTDAAKITYENHRVVYDDLHKEYSLTYHDEVTRCDSWGPIARNINATLTAAGNAPLLICCRETVLYGFRKVDDDVIALWKGLLNR